MAQAEWTWLFGSTVSRWIAHPKAISHPDTDLHLHRYDQCVTAETKLATIMFTFWPDTMTCLSVTLPTLNLGPIPEVGMGPKFKVGNVTDKHMINMSSYQARK